MNNLDYEPMDIDSSANSYAAMDISYNEIKEENTETPITKTDSQGIKKFHIDMPAQKHKRTLLKSNIYLVGFIIGSIITAILYYKVVNFECCREINTILLKDALSSKVHGQSKAVQTVIQALEANTSRKILILYGGTGVGKTLTISILLEKLLRFSNVYHYTMPSFVDKFTTEIKVGLVFCEKWFIIVDDLNPGDKHMTSIVNDIIEKTENLKSNVTIIFVYTCDTSNELVDCIDFLTNLQQDFNIINASKYFIQYLPLTEDVLKQCIKDELEQRLVLNVDIDMVMKNFNVSQDGCKGVHTKIKSLNLF
ncbi:PREDICTED: uncharacterized protein LOC106105392 [Papilio polytes]|uniref:uncharacterized protein LOC106105392 n=1 Tax=Papilio polytes TaxID=76194 RepID=UPI000675D3EE|nr:PREDICTED: uncharacterized protein LOC106105392 [Papilio polytes]